MILLQCSVFWLVLLSLVYMNLIYKKIMNSGVMYIIFSTDIAIISLFFHSSKEVILDQM